MTDCNETVTRVPAPGESEARQLELHRARCDMAADGEDVYLAAHYFLECRTRSVEVVYQRAKRAGVAPRREALTRFALADWKQAVKAIFAVAFGPLLYSLRRGRELIELLYGAESASEARRCLEAFLLDRELDYCAGVLIRALEVATASKEAAEVARRREVIEELAKLGGLLAQYSHWEYEQTTSPHTSGYVRKDDDRWGLHEVLASGWLENRGDLSELLAFWAGLANQKGVKVPVPETLSAEAVMDWARAVLAVSRAAEQEKAPSAGFETDEGGDIILSWRGTSTPSRWVDLTLHFEEGAAPYAKLRWSSGTGKPSRFLRIERFLASPKCQDFGGIEQVFDENPGWE